MLSLSSQIRLKNLLISLASHEKEIESLRQKLANIDEFEPYSCYRLIDNINKKQIGGDDIIQFFRSTQKDVRIDEDDAQLYVLVNDFDNKGFINFHKYKNSCY